MRFTSMSRTVLDLANVLDPKWLQAVVDSAIRLNDGDPEWLTGTLAQAGNHRGIDKLRTIEAAYRDDPSPGDSIFESFVYSLFTLPPPIRSFPVRDQRAELATVDLAWPEAKLIVELDGWKYHSNRHAFENDRARDRALQDLGWLVRRYTWRQLKDAREDNTEALKRLYEQRLALMRLVKLPVALEEP